MLGRLLFALLALPTWAIDNPVLWEDLADLDIFRVDDTYYYSASTMAYSPGAPILSSTDLLNWQYIGHSVPRLEFGDDEAYGLENGEQAYVRGIWASSMRYRPSNGQWYWIGCVDFAKTYVYTAGSPSDTWNLAATIDTCYYDVGLLFDDEDRMLVACGSTDITVTHLNDDFTENSTQVVFQSSIYIEGARFYQIDGVYYILTTEPPSSEWTLKSTGDWTGPYEQKVLADAVDSPIPGAGNPHQGGIVDTPDGDWYYMAFVDAYPGGRVPVLAPITFDGDGWPVLGSFTDGTLNEAAASVSVDFAQSQTLSAEWEWNHNPENSKWSFVDSGLQLQAASVTDDLFHAKNTLTRRIRGPASTATVKLDLSGMLQGDRAGLALFRDNTAYISYQDGAVSLWRDLALGDGWDTISTGTQEAQVEVATSQIWFRLNASIAPESDTTGTFSYSTDGDQFTQLGTPYQMNTTWMFFMGYRFGIFNFATSELGGSVVLEDFEMETGSS